MEIVNNAALLNKICRRFGIMADDDFSDGGWWVLAQLLWVFGGANCYGNGAKLRLKLF